jgi:glycerophosphoryl diester phosphodiesterase
MKRRGDALLVLGHRGYRARFPENTMLAFRAALSGGADGIECDLQKCADGAYVVIHDPTTERVSGERRDVRSSTLQELQGLNFGRGERIPTLEEMLDSLPRDAYLDLELKEETIRQSDADSIAAILDAHRTRDLLMISSFSAALLVPFRRMGFTVGLLVGEEAAARGLIGFASALFWLRPQFLNLPVDMLHILGRHRAEFLFRFLRACGLSLLFWTVNSTPEASVLARHARIIVTDEVDLIVGTTSFTEN